MPNRLILITQELDQARRDMLADMLPDWKMVIGKQQAVWEEHLKDAEIILGWKKGMEHSLTEPTKTKWIQSWSAGVNSLPLTELEAKGIHLTTASGVHAYPISETIIGLMLALTRKIHTYVRNQQKQKWHHEGLKEEMHGKTLCLVGTGAIGKETAALAKAFQMKVIGINTSGLPLEGYDQVIQAADLDRILPCCDYVVLNLPLTSQTRNMFTARQFMLMNPSAYFINVGRGQLVKEDDLIHALQSGMIAGAGLDVFTEEPLSSASPLWKMENVIITPHTSGSTEYYEKRVVEDIFIPNLRQYLETSLPSINLVDYQKGY